MKRRKILILLLIAALATQFCFATNMQKIFTTRDDIYQRVEALCMRAGVIGPSSFSPLTARSLEIALERIDRENLSPQDKAEYDYLYSQLTPSPIYSDKNFSFNFGAGVNLYANIADYDDFNYSHSDLETVEWDHRENTLIPYRYEKGLFTLSLDMQYSDFVYIDAEVQLKNPSDRMYATSLSLFKYGLSSEWPQRAGLSLGNDVISLILGRFPHSIGSGVSGNLTVGDNFNYQEVMLLSFLSNHFTYNISVTRFDQQATASSTGGGNWMADFTRNKFSGLQQYRVVHRFDVVLLNKLRFALDLTTIYQGNGLDYRFFYPFVISHNYWNYSNSFEKQEYDEANNLMTISFEWSIAKSLTFTAQVAIDQFQMPWEELTELPLAFGALANLKWSTSTPDGGRFTGWFEAVYTNPYLYLNGKTDESINSIDYNLDYVVGYNSHYMDDYGWSGYIYGPDNIVFSTGFKYQQKDNDYEIGLNLLYKAQGNKGLRHRSASITSFELDMSHAIIENDSSIFMNNIWTPSGGWKTAEHLIKLGLFGQVNFVAPVWRGLTVSMYSGLGGNFYYNFNHVAGLTEFQPQLLIGLSCEV